MRETVIIAAAGFLVFTMAAALLAVTDRRSDAAGLVRAPTATAAP
jgi:hypothetical protein